MPYPSVTRPTDAVEDGSVQRVREDSDQRLRDAPREPRVRVEREDVPHRRQDRQLSQPYRVSGVVRVAQEPVELLELAPLPLPAHEDALFRIPPALPVEEEETVPGSGGVAAVEGLDSGDGGGEDLRVALHRLCGRVLEVTENREVDVRIEVAEGLHLEVLEKLLDARHASEESGHDHHRAGALGDASDEIEAGQSTGWHERGDEALDDERGKLARGDRREKRRGRHHPGSPRGADVFDRREDAEAGQDADSAEVRRRRVGEGESAEPLSRRRAKRHVDLEAEPARADQVMADVRGPVADPLQLRRLARALDGAQGDAHLCLSGGLGKLLHSLAVAVAALEIHSRVDGRRVAPQDLLHQADPLHVAAPVERAAEPQARDRVARRGLIGGLTLVLGTDGVLGRRPSGGECLLHPGVERRDSRVGLAHPLPQLREEGAVKRLGKRLGWAAVRQPVERGVRLPPGGSAGEDPRRQDSQVLQERELEHAGPCPELADRQRRHGLIGEDEARESLRVEPPVAVPDQLQRHRVDAGLAREVARGEPGELLVVPRREVVAHGARLRLDEVKVVEEPLGRGVDGIAPADVAGQETVGLAKDPEIRVQPGPDVVPSRAGLSREREDAGQGLRALLEALEAQKLAPQRRFFLGRAPSEQESHQRERFSALVFLGGLIFLVLVLVVLFLLLFRVGVLALDCAAFCSSAAFCALALAACCCCFCAFACSCCC